jgi:methyltransferase
MPPEPLRAQRVEQVIRAYIKACNDADAAGIAACFHPDAVHYFPHQAKWSGASTIGSNFARRVHERGLYWTIDQVIVDGSRSSATLEWTQFDRQRRILRGVDWFVFEPETLRIQEVRPYTAARLDPDVDSLNRRRWRAEERIRPGLDNVESLAPEC